MRVVMSVAIGLTLLLPTGQALTQSALEANPAGWTDLFADRTLKAWARGPLNAAGALRAGSMDEPSPWKMDPATGVLLCEGDKVGHEWLRYTTEFVDAVFHVEFRFTKLDGEPAYNAGVFIRSSADGTIWHQAQATPAGGFLFGSTLVNGTAQRFNTRDKLIDKRAKPAGEWNVYELTAVGRKLSAWVNGAVTSEFTECDVPRGHVGLEAEGYRVEYRNAMAKVLK